MRSAAPKKPKGETSGLVDNSVLYIGEITEITADGEVFVSCIDCRIGQMRANLASQLAYEGRLTIGAKVLLAFCDNDETPIAVDLIQENIQARIETGIHRVMDGDRLLLEADKQITLKCGKSTISLTKDGKVTVRGTKVTSRASSTNKIKGSTVSVN